MDEEKIRVLIIDDDEDDYVIAEELLEDAEVIHFDIEWADTYEKGQTLIREDNHDVYLIDYRLGGESGMDLIRQAVGRGINRPMILLTGQGDHEIDLEAMKSGASDYLVKGQIDTQLLERSIRHSIERKNAERRIKESEEKFRLLFDRVFDSIFMIDLDGNLVDANQTGLSLLGYTREELIKLNVRDVHPPEDHAEAARVINDVLRTGTAHSDEIRLVTKTGNMVSMEVGGGIFEVQGKRFIIGSFRDITERKRMREQQLHSEKLASVGSLVGGIAHELNNPLTAVIGYAQLLTSSRKEDPDLAKKFKMIDDSAQRCKRIIDNLLKFARQTKTALIKTHVNDIVDKSIELVNYDLQKKNISVVTEQEENLPVITADPYQVQQVLINLMQNARDAMLSVCNEGEIQISTFVRNQHVVIRLADNGPGIPSDIAKRIFDPFFTTKEVGKGTGLGLSVSYGIIIDHNGDLKLIETEGGGAVFEIVFPIPITSQLNQPGEPQLPESKEGDRLEGLKILIIDDENNIVSFMKRFLEHEGASVNAETDAESAKEDITGNKYDVILCDIRMPGTDGISFYEWIEANHPEQKKGFVFATGDSVNPQTREYIKTSGCPVLHKPFVQKEILEVIGQVLS